MRKAASVKQQMRDTMRGWASRVSAWYMFVSPSLYWQILQNPAVQQQQLYCNLSLNTLFPTQLHGAFSHVVIGGTVIVCVSDPIYGINDGEGFLVPKFAGFTPNELSPLMMFNALCSRHLELSMSADPLGEYHYAIQDKFTNYELFTELSQMPVVMNPRFTALKLNA